MGCRLAPTLSYCCTEGQRIFLDAKRDRYFCLSGGLEASFERWATGQPLTPSDEANIGKLVAEKLLVETSGPDIRPAACPSPDPPRISLFDRAVRAADLWRWHAVEEIEHKGVAYDTAAEAEKHAVSILRQAVQLEEHRAGVMASMPARRPEGKLESVCETLLL